MRPHLPLKLAAYLLVALVGASAQTQGADSISIDFSYNGYYPMAGYTAGYSPVDGKYWNKFSDASATKNVIDSTGATLDTTVTWSSSGLYGWYDGTWTEGDAVMYYSYLDDNGANVNITMKNVQYLAYDVYIYCNTDSGSGFSAKTVNGVSYSFSEGATVKGSTEAWGSQGLTGSIVLGTNALAVTDQIGTTLTIYSPRQSIEGQDPARGSITGIQVVDSYKGTARSTTLGTGSWTSSALGNSAWKDSTSGTNTATDNSYADITATAGTTNTLTIADGETRTTDAIFLSGGDATIKGGTITLVNAAQLRADANSTLTIESTITNDSFSVFGDGVVKLGADKTLTGLTGTGTLGIASNKTLSISSTALAGFTGGLSVDSNATLNVTGTDTATYSGNLALAEGATVTFAEGWTITGDVKMSVADYQNGAFSALTANAGSITLTGDSGAINIAWTDQASVKTVNYDGGKTVTKTSSSAVVASLASTTGVDHLHIQEGSVQLNEGATYSIKNITIDNGARLYVGGAQTKLDNTNIKMNAGSYMSLLNGHAYGEMVNTNIEVNATSGRACIEGSYFGYHSILTGEIKGTGNLWIMNYDDTYRNSFTINSKISDKDVANKLSLVINKQNPSDTTNEPYGVTIGGNNSYSGGTFIQAGTVSIKSATALGTGAVSIEGGGLFGNNLAIENEVILRSGFISALGTDTQSVNVSVDMSDSYVSIGSSYVNILNSTISTGQYVGVSDGVITFSNTSLVLDKQAANSIFTLSNSTMDFSGLILKLNFDVFADGITTLAGDGTITSINVFFEADNANTITGLDKLVMYDMNGNLLDWNREIGVSLDSGNLIFTDLYIVPEPATASLSLLGLAALMMRRRRVAK